MRGFEPTSDYSRDDLHTLNLQFGGDASIDKKFLR